MRYLVGLDDTDSSQGMCTTYLAYRIARDLKPVFRVLPYPRLVRLNPNVPFKTRGNAAVCLEIEAEDGSRAFNELCEIVSKYSDVEHGANSGLVFLENTKLVFLFQQLYRRAIRGIVNMQSVKTLLRDNHVKAFSLGNGMGLVGAAASIGFDLKNDHTYELIAYRKKSYWGTKRGISPESVLTMDAATFPHTFNNYDYQKGKVLIAPHGPDPVLAGVRGDSPSVVIEAFKMLRFSEEPKGYMVYISNQCTDAHLLSPVEDKVYYSGWVEGRVASTSVGKGGHVYIALDNNGEVVHCAIYEPTGDLRRVARMLIRGDVVRLYGGVRRPAGSKGKILNVEKLEVLSLAPVLVKPRCKVCSLLMKSEGENKGFQCRRCGSKLPPSALRRYARLLQRGIYLPSPRAHRHLTKPLARYGRETTKMIERAENNWLVPLAILGREHS